MYGSTVRRLLKILRTDQMNLNESNLNDLEAESKLPKKSPEYDSDSFWSNCEVSGSLVTFKMLF